MFSSSIYGLQLRSNLAIPGLIVLPYSSPADLTISFGQLPKDLHEQFIGAAIWHVNTELGDDHQPSRIIYKSNSGDFYLLRYADGTEFVFDRQCTQVWATWPESLTLEDTAIYLLGPVLGILL